MGSIPGILRTRVGYCGGKAENPTYRKMGDHTEAIQIDFDPSVLSYEKVLSYFWHAHNPVHPGTYEQYKAILWTHNAAQAKQAATSRDTVAKDLGETVKTEIVPFKRFYPAEDYHQKYRLRHVARVARSVLKAAGSEEAFRESTTAAKLNSYVSGYGTASQLDIDLKAMSLSDGEREHIRVLFKKNLSGPVRCGGN